MGKFDLDDILNDLDTAETGLVAETSIESDPAVDSNGLETSSESITVSEPPASSASDESQTESSTDESPLNEEEGDLGRALLRRGNITEEQLDSAQRVKKQTPGKSISSILIEMGVEEILIQEVVAEQSRLPFEEIDPSSNDQYDYASLNKLGPEYCKTHLVLPLRREGTRMVVGTTCPNDVFRLDEVKRKLNVPSIKHVLMTAGNIRAVIELLNESEAEEYNVDELLADVDEDDVEVVKDQLQDADVEDAESSPVVRYVNHIIQTAVREGASDIHIEPDEKTLKVRFRIDGVLFEMMNPPRKMHAAITSRIKIMSNLDIAERRLPQDGRIRATVMGRKLDLRVSTVPTPKGEKTVMRILDTRAINVTLDELGFEKETLTEWKQEIGEPHGIILVTGPTGSGKTTTLYASIQQMDLRKLNVSTVEDPVEYNLSNITQIQTHEKIGMTFAAALRALLRQDPDVVMVGEIRDSETATTAIQAAMTGHLVLSTLHTNDAPSSITRLINIGVEPFLVGAAVNAVLAQRLVRRVCKHCGKDIPVTDEVKEYLTQYKLEAETVRHGNGCDRCRKTGYSGRAGLYELLRLEDLHRDAIARNPNVTEFQRLCHEQGMVNLRADGFRKVAKGSTTVEEVLRVTESGH